MSTRLDYVFDIDETLVEPLDNTYAGFRRGKWKLMENVKGIWEDLKINRLSVILFTMSGEFDCSIQLQRLKDVLDSPNLICYSVINKDGTALKPILERNGYTVQGATYVGDLRGDFLEARSVGMNFIPSSLFFQRKRADIVVRAPGDSLSHVVEDLNNWYPCATRIVDDLNLWKHAVRSDYDTVITLPPSILKNAIWIFNQESDGRQLAVHFGHREPPAETKKFLHDRRVKWFYKPEDPPF